MKKLLICLLMLFCAINFVSAQNADLSVPSPALLPTSPLYFLKDVGREVQMLLTFDPIKKAELRLEFANQKLAEANKVSENEPNNEQAVNKALENYKKETERLTGYAATLKKGSANNEALLNKVTESNFVQQAVLEKIENRTKNKEKVQEVKDRALENLTTTSFSVAEPAQVKAQIQTSLQNREIIKVKTIEMLKKMEEKLSDENEKKVILEVEQEAINEKINDSTLTTEDMEKIKEYATAITENKVYQKMLVRDFAQKIIGENQETLNQLKDISAEDAQKLNDFASQILAGEEIDFNKIITEFNALPISSDSKKIIDDVQSRVINNVNRNDVSCLEATNPVCGQDGKDYESVCEAVKAGTSVAYKGSCAACVKEGESIPVYPGNENRVCCSGLTLCPPGENILGIRGTCQKTCAGGTGANTGNTQTQTQNQGNTTDNTAN